MFLMPWGLVGMIAVPLILLFYILKQKREKLTVSSLILWQQVLQDMQARTPWQKLRKNLLMFLQILAAIFITLALAGFALRLSHGEKEAVIIVMDVSLSMSSTDIQPSRLDAAKSDAIKYAGNLSNDSRVTVVTLGRNTDVLLFASTSKDEIVRTIQSIEPTNGYMDPVKAEELLLSLKRQDPDANIILFGDRPVHVGNETIQFSNYEKQNNNLALIHFTHTRSNDQISAMSILRNQGDTDTEASISLYGDDEFVDSQRVTVPANETQTVWWRDISPSMKNLHCVIEPGDILEADNHAYDTVLSTDLVKVLLVTEGNYFLEKIFSLIEGVELVRTLPEGVTEYKGYDLYVLDGTIPSTLPTDGNIVIFAPEQNSLFPVGGWMDTPQVKPVEHAVYQHLDSMSFSIGRSRIMEKPDWAEIVLEASENPIIMEGQMQNIRILIFGFNLYETDLPLRSEFPVLISNILVEYAPAGGMAISGVLTGEPVQFRLQPDTQSAKVILPNGRNVTIAPPMPPQPFLMTDQAGIYSLEQKKRNDTSVTSFAVNLPDEWLMESGKAVSVGGNEQAGMNIPIQNAGFPLTTSLLVAAMIILLLEWWYYANRNYI
ncbi:MAG: VWA domain-containing protein [Clostridiaceae bacterium]|jgi:hypothetical protein|nr:VWA domain-containing protein [Clostridiaceae bacterium]